MTTLKRKNKEKPMRKKPLRAKQKEYEKIIIRLSDYAHLTPPPLPSALRGKKKKNDGSHILEKLKKFKANIPLLDMIK